jgi:SSS family solute:Na+ symporter
LLAGWAVGLAGGTYFAWVDGLKPLHTLVMGDTKITLYVGLLALVANILVTILVNALLPQRRSVISTAE